MKCKFEHDGDCCNSGSPQYMCKCKPKICESEVPMTNADRIRAMTDEELADFIDDWWCIGANEDQTYATHEARMEWLQSPAEEDA